VRASDAGPLHVRHRARATLAGVPPARPDTDAFATAAIEWFDRHARDLPWRRAGTSAWAVLVSEVMLQQTPVVRVLPAWTGWLDAWPTPAALAAATPGDAIRAWGRLGYPRRALRLHDCATAMVARHDGEVPRDIDALLALPGIGTYTAHAVAAFAYGQRCPVVDTNVRRVVARAIGGAPDAGATTTAADLRAAEELLPVAPGRAARASAAYMEIGAVVCTARTPRCVDCPVRTMCRWLARGEPLPDGPSRRPQTYAGTHRQIRGRLLAVLRDSSIPVTRAALDVAWNEPSRRAAALASLMEDGLVVQTADGDYALAGHR
jgi:A/G-specific adenine glycosylase